MSGYSAPKLETVRVGFIGVGNRGSAAVFRMSHIEGVDIKAICDIRPEKTNAAKQRLAGSTHNPTLYTRNEQEWKKLCDRNDIDLVYVSTHWQLHTPMALYAMNQGKHVCVEIPAATTIDECWQLVETSEKTKKHCMMLENCCYGFFELLTLNMARQGFFGDIVHCEGAYIHDLLEGNFSKEKYWEHWRLKENLRNGNLYPTHGLGPVSQIMDLNRGDKMDYLVSLSSNDFMMGNMARELAEKDDVYKPYVNKSFRGNMNTSIIKTSKGRSLMIQHDVTSPRPYSRIHLVSGTKATAQGFPLPEKIATGHQWATEEEFSVLQEKYKPEISKKIGDIAKKFGGSLSKNQAAVTSGAVTAAEQRLHNLKVVRYISTASQRSSSDDLNWPNEQASNKERFLEYAVTPQTASSGLKIETIKLSLSFNSSSAGRADIAWSTDGDNFTPIVSNEKLTPGSVPKEYEFKDLNIAVPPSKTFYLRVYPWTTSPVETKYLVSKEVSIEGMESSSR